MMCIYIYNNNNSSPGDSMFPKVSMYNSKGNSMDFNLNIVRLLFGDLINKI